MKKMYSLARVFVLLLVIENLVQLCQCTNSTYGCTRAEREALFTFKQSFGDPSDKLSSWEGTDCCEWKGVVCESDKGYVIKIDLRSTTSTRLYLLEGSKLDSSLLQLRYLNYLDLSENDFDGSPIPEFLGKMNGLTYLNLSYTYFKTGFPPQLGNLTNLQVLDVSYIYGVDELDGYFKESFEWLSGLSSLKCLYMRGVDLSGAHNLLPILDKLPSLSVLGLSACQLDVAQLSATYSNLTFLSSVQELYLERNSFVGSSFLRLLKNMTSLRVLALSGNGFSGEIPMWLADLKDLEYLDLAGNKFNKVEGGLWRILSDLCHLKTFDFSFNNFHQESLESDTNMSHGCIIYGLEALNGGSSGLTGVLPDELCQFKKLKYVDLSNNTLHGSIFASIGNLTALIELHLEENRLNGTIPASLGNLSSLKLLSLWDNQLQGAIPESIGNLSALTYLNLSRNNLSDVVPGSIGQLFNLVIIDISLNYLTGNISETHFLNVTKLRRLKFTSNQLTITVTPDWIPPFQLEQMEMGSCKIGTVFPRWVGTQKKVISLVLSNASITGPWPKWFQSSHLWMLDISHNQINGHIPHNIADLLPGLNILRLSNNSVNGTIPDSFCKMEGLLALDLSRNMLSGNIPNCWEENQGLYILKLSFNKLNGVIPSSIGNLSRLRWLHLNNNHLKGVIPSSLRSCESLIVLNLNENEFSGSIPTWIGTMRELQVLVLRNNHLDGYIPMQLCQMLSLQILDLAGNKLTGKIPRCLGDLTAMTVKHLIQTYNGELFSWFMNIRMFTIMEEWTEEDLPVIIKRNTLQYKNSLQVVVNIDLSNNKLVGIIPPEVTLLSQLLGLNLSYNHLTGTIPKNIGNLTSLESLDLSNNQLFGDIPATLSLITFLAHLNLSHNNLSGKIPTGAQIQTLSTDLSIYDGNPNLCGTPLRKSCTDHEPFHVPVNNEENKFDDIWLYLAITAGYAVGLWGFFAILMIKKKWRHAYFRYMDDAKDWLYVTIVVTAARLKRKMTGVEE